MTKKEAIHFLYQIADEIQSFLDKTSSPKGQWTSHKRLEALSMAISALYDLFQAEEDGRLIIPPCKVGDTVKCSGIVYRQTDSGKIIPVGQQCGAKTSLLCAGWGWMCLSNLWRQQR